jgi:hypothetical protein
LMPKHITINIFGNIVLPVFGREYAM